MDEVKRRMQLSDSQRRAIIQLDDHGVPDPAPLLVMDFASWQAYRPINFFNYFAKDGTIASFAKFKPAWQRYTLLYPTKAESLQKIYDRYHGNPEAILKRTRHSRAFYYCYVRVSSLVDELDRLVDKDLIINDGWNQGYVLNDRIDPPEDNKKAD